MPATPPETAYDVFISYSPADETWVTGTLLPRLEKAGLRICIDRRDFRPGAPRVEEVQRAVQASRKTLLILTPAYLADEWAEFGNLMVQTLDPASRDRRLIPLLKAKCDLPLRICHLTHVDFAQPYDWDVAWRQLLNALSTPLEQEERRLPQAGSLPPTPFTNTLAIRDPARFVGREAELRRLHALLEGGSAALLGEPKIGKSSLLWQLKNSWEGMALGPLDCLELVDSGDFYECLAQAVGLDHCDWRTIRRALNESRALLLLDELDAGPQCGITHADLARFRAACSKNPGFKMVAVSRRPLKEIFPDPGLGSPAYNFLQPLTLGPMPEAEARFLLSHPWAPTAPQFDAATCDHLLAVAGGHPFKLQRAAYHRYLVLADPTYDWQGAYRQDMEQML